MPKTEAEKEYQREYRKARWAKDEEFRNKARRLTRDYQINKLYGLSRSEYDEMFLAQGGKCASCKDSLGSGHGTNVDHDHVTGQVRGLLCHGCNLALGHLKDDVERVRALAAYIASFGGDE
jgi:hypothetical protein